MKPPGALLTCIVSILVIYWGLCTLTTEVTALGVFCLIGGILLAIVNTASMFHETDTRRKIIIVYLIILAQIIFVLIGDRPVESNIERYLIFAADLLTPLALGVLGSLMTKKWWFAPAMLGVTVPLNLVWLFFRDYSREPYGGGDIQLFLPIGLIGLIGAVIIYVLWLFIMCVAGAITEWVRRRYII